MVLLRVTNPGTWILSRGPGTKSDLPCPGGPVTAAPGTKSLFDALCPGTTCRRLGLDEHTVSRGRVAGPKAVETVEGGGAGAIDVRGLRVN